MTGQGNPVATQTILLVEDERILALDLQRTLRGLGFSVPLSVGSGEEALRVAEEVSFGLVVMDIRLRGKLDGIETARRLRARHHVALVYIGGDLDEPTLERAAATAPYACLAKPFTQVALLAAIDRAFRALG